MIGRYRFIILIIAIIALWKIFQYMDFNSPIHSDISKIHSEKSKTDKGNNKQVIKVSVYYETLCSDSRNFVLKHLLPTYKLLNKYINLDLVPYGKAKTIETDDGKITFQCQHAAAECVGNKINACAIREIQDPLQQLEYIACMITDSMVPFEAAERCGHEQGIDFNSIIDCSNDIKSSLLLKAYGERTMAVRPTITFIPTIQFDDTLKVPLSQVLKDFKKELCNSFIEIPEECL